LSIFINIHLNVATPELASLLTRKKINFHNKFSERASDTKPQNDFVMASTVTQQKEK